MSSRRSSFRLTVLAAALALAALSPAVAQERHDFHDDRGWHYDRGWHDRDMHHFAEHDFARWQHGRWYHGVHGGRDGWWWIVGPEWYFYPRPTYPYPSPYVPPAVAEAPNTWYYCPPAQQYYPYVPTCPVPWQPVPAQ